MTQQPRYTSLMQAFMVLLVLAATIFLAIKNNQPEIINNLVTLVFGYYFGVLAQSTPPDKPA